MQDAKEEIRSRLNIEDIIGEYISLKRAGRNFRGLSPFTSERTPSFYVSPDKQIWHDFSSGKGGDVFSFVMLTEGMDFKQALEYLANKAGLDVSLYLNKGEAGLSKKKDKLFKILNYAVIYYQQTLVKNPSALEYVVKKRKISRDIIRDFRIGYSPKNSRALVDFMVNKGFAKSDIDDAGLTNRFGGDLFKGRMMIPLMDSTGRVIGFTGRIIDDQDKNSPKYLNTPQTILYDKSRHVFGLSQAKESIRKKDYAVIVEGNMDVITSHQYGFKQVVATAGTAMTEQHLKGISRISNNIKLAFDNDKAGMSATERAIPIAQKVGVSLSIVNINGAKDADELIHDDPNEWEKCIENSEAAMEWILRQYSNREDMSSAAGKKNYTTAAVNIIKTITDTVEKEFYLKKIANDADTSLESIVSKMEDTKDAATTKLKRSISSDIKGQKNEYIYQDDLLSVMFSDIPSRDLLNNIDPNIFKDDDQKKVAIFLQKDEALYKDVPKKLQSMSEYVKILLFKAEARYSMWSSQERYYEAAKLISHIKSQNIKTKREELISELKQTESDNDEEKSDLLRREINELIKEMKK
jgi:DNA primase